MTAHNHVVLGGGVLGQEVARQLVAQGASVRLVSRSGTRIAGVEPVIGDLTDPASVIAASRNAEIIYFCAAPPYQDWTRSFASLQEGAIGAARQSGAVLVAGENLYGYGKAGRLTEDQPLTAQTRKGAVRALMSQRLFKAHADQDIRAVSGRASDFFGPGVVQSALGSRFWPDLIKGKPIAWFGDARKLHTFTYLPDFARALITLGQRSDAWGRAWHVPSPQTITPQDVATRAAAIIGAPAPRLRTTPAVVLRLVGIAVPAAGEMVEMHYAFNNDFIMLQDDWERHFDWRATDWHTALGATLQFWQKAAAA